MSRPLKYLFLLFILFPAVTFAQRTEVVVLGTIHPSSESFNPDSILNVLSRIKPGVILMELDSSFFSADFQFTKDVKENEFIAVKKYRERIDVVVRPYDYTGRNDYHKKLRVKKNYKEVLAIIDTLYRSAMLDNEQRNTVEAFYRVGKALDVVAEGAPFEMNNCTVDSLVRLRQYYYYSKIREIVDQREELSPYRNFYNAYARFWDTRNKAMTNHIIRFINDNPGKRIIVLTGFLHRYYLLNELRPLQEKNNFQLREYYDF